MVSVGLSLTPRALFYRNLVKMGPTSLRSTVCYNLLMMAKPQPYEVIVDPMCGGGSISLEVSHSRRQSSVTVSQSVAGLPPFRAVVVL